MNDNSEIIEVLLQRIIKELKSQEFFDYADHKNLWIDLGWDVSNGDGEICGHVETLLEHKITHLPEHIKHLLWLESWGGRVMKEDILETLQKQNGDLSKIEAPEPDEVLADITDYLKEKLFSAAEAAYDEFQEKEYSDDEDEYEEIDEDDQ
jgi:hypothetical protein